MVVINEMVNEKVDIIEVEENCCIKKKEWDEIKENIIYVVLFNVFIKLLL